PTTSSSLLRTGAGMLSTMVFRNMVVSRGLLSVSCSASCFHLSNCLEMYVGWNHWVLVVTQWFPFQCSGVYPCWVFCSQLE
ncbi:hypothetical protein GOODEAATRI_032921, partial [Goodea atripinnis]